MKTIVKDRPYIIPSFYQVIREELEQDPIKLESHFNDLYKLLLRRMADFEMQTNVDYKLENELAALLSELIRIKRAIQESA